MQAAMRGRLGRKRVAHYRHLSTQSRVVKAQAALRVFFAKLRRNELRAERAAGAMDIMACVIAERFGAARCATTNWTSSAAFARSSADSSSAIACAVLRLRVRLPGHRAAAAQLYAS